MRVRPHPHPARRLRAAIGGAVVLALLVMQLMGLVHRIVHGVPGPAGSVAMAGIAQVDDAKRTIFSHDVDTCSLFDQLTHADALWSAPVLSVADVRPAASQEVHRSWHLARQSAGFLARGPPSLS